MCLHTIVSIPIHLNDCKSNKDVESRGEEDTRSPDALPHQKDVAVRDISFEIKKKPSIRKV